MNRAERRRAGKQVKKEPTYNLTQSQIEEMKQSATREAENSAFVLMLGIPVIVLRDHFGQLIRKNWQGATRLQRFVDYCLDYYERFDAGELTLDGIQSELETQSGIQIIKKEEKR